MGKTRSEIQKAYRERKAQKEGVTWRAAESKRVLKYYKATKTLTRKECQLRRTHNNKAVRKHRKKIKDQLQQVAMAELSDFHLDDISVDSGLDDTTMDTSTPLTVRMPFVNQRLSGRGKGPRKKRARALARAHKQINTLQKKVKRTQKRLERLAKRKHSSKQTPLTPNSKTRHDLEEASKAGGLSSKLIKRKLLLGNAILHNIRTKTTRRKLTSSHQWGVRGELLKKYGLLRSFARETGVCRRAILRCKKSAYASKLRAYKVSIEEFLTREDNSRMLPGKKDAKKVQGGEKRQTMVLSDYLSNLHRKYIAENPTCHISFTTFCRARPRNIKLVHFANRNICLCQQHQNLAMLLKAISSAGTPIERNPEVMIEKLTNEDEIRSKLVSIPPVVNYTTWQNVITADGIHKKLRQVAIQKTREEFIEHFVEIVAGFREHVFRMQEQFAQLRVLKGNLPQNDAIIQMDFAQNYSCRSLDEIQSAYFSQTGVTIHPVVIYYKAQEGDELHHKSFVIISNEMSHSANTVLTIINKLVPELKKMKPNLERIHYWTDGPTSQYRNKAIFYAVSTHTAVYGISAIWNYFEAGHGKGPCDGLGGTTKRMADDYVKTNRATIQDAFDFYAWTQQDPNPMPRVKFLFVSSEDCHAFKTAETTTDIVLRPVKGTMLMHAVRGKRNGVIESRITSCYCEKCMHGDSDCDWKEHGSMITVKTTAVPVIYLPELTLDEAQQEAPLQNNAIRHVIDVAHAHDAVLGPAQEITPDLDVIHSPIIDVTPAVVMSEGEFVGVDYFGDWYIAQILMVDEDDKEMKVSFMKATKAGTYVWPTPKDDLWVEETNIVCKISAPNPIGRSARAFRFSKDDINTIEVEHRRRSINEKSSHN